METTKEEKEFLTGETLQKKVLHNNRKRRLSKLVIYSIHGLFLVLAVMSAYFGSWLGAGALLVLWGVLVFSF
ncbi:hypothetical protein [Alcanivorax hongdengensis]|uniref:hypothetical protein n=1 Tax=Alcanivorax hongdengensis TaxID=519051 RepID=UPI0012F9ED43|nr:hypothetical protein [Alcanivorax hongdengensis]